MEGIKFNIDVHLSLLFLYAATTVKKVKAVCGSYSTAALRLIVLLPE